MKTIIKSTAISVSLMVIVCLFSYHRNRKNNRFTVINQLITNTSASGWQLDKVIYSGNELEMNACYRNNNQLIFYADGTYRKSTYKCDDGSSRSIAAPQVEIGNWNWNEENRKLKLGKHTYNLLSLTPAELVLKLKSSKYYFVKVKDRTLLHPVQLLSGLSSKTWKYKKCIINGLEQEAAPLHHATQIINRPDGNLIAFYTETATKQQVTGKWSFDAVENTYTTTFSTGKLPGMVQPYFIVELTENTFVVAYEDNNNQQVELHYACN